MQKYCENKKQCVIIKTGAIYEFKRYVINRINECLRENY